jgi:hypothetical protein
MIDNSKSYLRALVSESRNSVKSLGYQQLTVSGSVQNLTIPTGATYALCVIESIGTGIVARVLQNKASVVSAGVGMPLYAGSILDISDFANLDGFQIIQESASTTKINIEYFK